MLAGEELACPAEAHGHFIGNEKDVMAFAQIEDTFKDLCRINTHAHGGLHHGLDDTRGHGSALFA